MFVALYFFHSFDKLDVRFIIRFKYCFTCIVGRSLCGDMGNVQVLLSFQGTYIG